VNDSHVRRRSDIAPDHHNEAPHVSCACVEANQAAVLDLRDLISRSAFVAARCHEGG